MNSNKILDYLGWALLIIAIIIMRFFEQLIDNIIKAKSFILEYSIYGMLLSLLILFTIYKLKPEYFKSGEEKRGSAILSYFFGILMIFMFGMSYYNLNTAKKNIKSIKAFVVKKTKNTRYGTKYLKLKFNNNIERFQPKDKEWEEIKEKDSIFLTIGQGKLGYKHILEFNK